MDILPTNEYVKIDDRAYVNPQVGLDETNSFIDNLRSTQAQQNKEIITDTRNLGTDIPSNLGGLTGAESYFTSRYQTPQTNAVVANLRAVAQANALNQALQNEQALWKKRYNDAYRNYQQSIYNNTNPNNPTNPTNPKLPVDTNPTNRNNLVNENKNTGPGKIIGTKNGLNVYKDYNGNEWTLRNPEQGDEVLLGGLTSTGGNLKGTFPDGTPLKNGATYNAGGGRVFMYVNNGQTGGGAIYRVADSPTMSYR